MRRASVVAAICAAAFALAVGDASAASESLYKCEADATWQVTLNFTGASYADVTYDTGSGGTVGCRRENATVQSNGNFSVSLSDFGYATTARWNLTGVGIAGNPGTFAGAATYAGGGTGRGTFVIANGTALNAELVFAQLNGDQQVVEVTGTSSCGSNCYRTHMVWEGTQPPTT
jgi:hypothetical protein